MKNRITKRQNRGFVNENIFFYVCLFPFMSLFFLFNALPVLSSMILSLFDYDMVSNPIWIGL